MNVVRASDLAHLAALLRRSGGIKSRHNWATRERRAWAAGFFDGEGYVGNKAGGDKQHCLYLTAAVTQKTRPLLDRFQDTVGFGKVYGPHRSGAHTPMFAWTCYGLRPTLELLRVLGPWLGPVKYEQFVAAIAYYLRQSAKSRQWRVA